MTMIKDEKLKHVYEVCHHGNPLITGISGSDFFFSSFDFNPISPRHTMLHLCLKQQPEHPGRVQGRFISPQHPILSTYVLYHPVLQHTGQQRSVIPVPYTGESGFVQLMLYHPRNPIATK